MDSSSTSLNKIRKGLRNRRVCVPIVKPKECEHQASQRKRRNAKLDASRKNISDTPTKSSNFEHEDTAVSAQANDYIAETSKIGKRDAVKSKLNVPVQLASENEGGGGDAHCSKNVPITSICERELNNRSENKISEDSTDSEMSDLDEDGDLKMSGFNEDGSKDNVSESNEDEDDHIHAEVVESEDEKETCVESVLKAFNKDIGALYSKTDKIEDDLKEIKEILLSRPPQQCIRSISTRFKQKSAFSLLPK